MQGIQGTPGPFVVVGAPFFAPILFLRQLDTRSLRRSSHPTFEFSGKPPAPERAPRDDSQTFPYAQRNQFPFGAPAQKVVLRLEAYESFPTVRTALVDCPLQLPSCEVARSHVANHS